MVSQNTTLTPKTRRFVLMRDRCCQYVDKKTGLICESKTGLQVDHIIPRWAGGDNSEANLQVLCGQHNRLRYRHQAGVVVS
ncbi:HNH endonuclease [Bdellovibrio sp. KM01]|nr:HNH endonuclease [Bdellovibrio sp. KM01]